MPAAICLIAWLIKTKEGCVRRNDCDYCIPSDTNRTSWYEWYALVSWYTNLPLFLPSSSPYNPYYYLFIFLSPFHEDKLFYVPTPKWCDNCNNGKQQLTVLRKGSFPLQPSISKAIPLASIVNRRREMAGGSCWWMGCDYSRDGELTSFCSRLDM